MALPVTVEAAGSPPGDRSATGSQKVPARTEKSLAATPYGTPPAVLSIDMAPLPLPAITSSGAATTIFGSAGVKTHGSSARSRAVGMRGSAEWRRELTWRPADPAKPQKGPDGDTI
jgi:hypothetical protein